MDAPIERRHNVKEHSHCMRGDREAPIWSYRAT